MARGGRLRSWLLAALLATSVQGLAAETRSAERAGPAVDRLLVGAMVQQRELGTLDVLLADGDYLIPLESFAELTGCLLDLGEDGALLTTPLGAVRLLPEDLRDSESTLYVSDRIIEEKLATPVTFDASNYALEFDLPWIVGRGGGIYSTPPGSVVPDATPPSASLSTLHADLRYTQVSDVGYLRGLTTVGGALGGGYWRMRYEGSPDGPHNLRDYAWLLREENHLYLAGNQRVRLHPLLRSIEFTGMQYATTNHSLELFQHGPTPSELLSRRMQPTTTFEGYGPPAGIAELWIEGVIVDRQMISLDGQYRFLDVTIPGRQASRVEVRLYDRHNPSVPIEILEETRSASQYLLPGGTQIHMGGGGIEGNALQDAATREQYNPRGAAFYQTRHGLSDTLTLEAAIQGTEDLQQIFGGFVARLSPSFVVSLGLGASDNSKFGYSLDLEGMRRPWRLFGRFLATQGGFDSLTRGDQHDYMVEFGRQVGRNLDLALIGRSQQAPARNIDYVLPAVTWRPLSTLWLRARPDYDGEYRMDLLWRITPRTRLNLGTVEQRRTFGQLWHELSRRFRLIAEGEFGDDRPGRAALLVSGYEDSRWRASWQAGPQLTGGQLGYLLGGRVTLTPGIVAQAQLESEARVNDPELALEPRLLLNIVADLGFSGGRFVPARTAQVRMDRGGIAGGVRIEAPPGMPAFDLSGLAVTLDGRRVARTGAGGTFFIGSLEPGIYRLELDRENLPIELAPKRTVLHARVAGAAVTRLDFVVHPEFGIAGRVRDANGDPVAGLTIELLDGSRTVVTTVVTDRFGLYRIDGLPIGTYKLRLKPGVLPYAEDQPTRIVQIEDDFLFDQDLQLPVVLDEGTTGSDS